MLRQLTNNTKQQHFIKCIFTQHPVMLIYYNINSSLRKHNNSLIGHTCHHKYSYNEHTTTIQLSHQRYKKFAIYQLQKFVGKGIKIVAKGKKILYQRTFVSVNYNSLYQWQIVVPLSYTNDNFQTFEKVLVL